MGRVRAEKRIAALLAAVAALAVFSQGCALRTDFGEAVAHTFPQGYISKGGEHTGDVILRSACLEPGSGEDDFVAELSFAGSGGERLLETPAYFVYQLENPARLVISGYFAAHDIKRPVEESGAALFLAEEQGYFSIYLQFPGKFVFSLKRR